MSYTVHLLQDDEAAISDWLRRAEKLHRSLRPALPADYPAYLCHMFAEGARMAVLHDSREIVALAVYRIHHTTVQGRRFYVDDLVTSEGRRSKGLGAALLDWCRAKARDEGCDTFALDSGVQRAQAHRFYFRHGMVISSFGFSLDLRGGQ